MEQRFEVRPYGVKYICDTCSKGDMEPTGINDWSKEQNPFEHRCNNCGDKKMFTGRYPLIKYEVVH